MNGIRIEAAKCRLCKRCIRVCAEQALSLGPTAAAVDPARCTLCGVCVDSCPFDAITLLRETAAAAESGGVWVVCLAEGGAVPAVAAELLGKGHELAEARGTTLTALWFGPIQQAQTLIAAGADAVLALDSEAPAGEDRCIETLVREVEARRPEILLFGATDAGRCIAPAVAARLRTGLTADCTELAIDPEGLLRQTRPAFGGNLMADIVTPAHRPQMATVRPGVLRAAAPDPTRRGIVARLTAPEFPPRIELLERSAAGGGALADRDVILVAGRGVGNKKNLALVFALAEKLGASVGVTRPLVDTGVCEYRYQVGQTGRSVAPKLLISLGVSGAIQHLAGIGGAEQIVAVNTDPGAPIFSAAHYKVVADCMELVRELLARL